MYLDSESDKPLYKQQRTSSLFTYTVCHCETCMKVTSRDGFSSYIARTDMTVGDGSLTKLSANVDTHADCTLVIIQCNNFCWCFMPVCKN